LVPAYLISAVVYGTFFALMAMGLTLTYMTTKVPNFAYGSFVTIGLYTAYTMHYLTNVNPYGASLAAFVVSGLASVVMYIGILRPLAKRGTPLIGLMIATFGIDIGFSGIFGIYTDYLQAKYGLGDAKQFFALPGDFSFLGFQGVVFIAPIALILVTVALFILFTRTKFGVAMRASVENSSLARVLGINVERVYVVSWMLAGGFAGVAGALYTLWLPGGTATGSTLIVQIFAASILGGLSSIFGAVAGGLAVGASEDVVTTWLGQGFGYVFTSIVAVIIVILGVLVLIRKAKLPTFRIGDVMPWDIINRNVVVSGQGALGLVSILIGVYMLVEMATGFTTDFFVRGLVNGFGAAVLPFETAIPLMIMVIALMVLPQGLVSIKLRRKRK
jgi:branched-chain amino acid transport system permease protein